MVRLEIKFKEFAVAEEPRFTFQYGQIRNYYIKTVYLFQMEYLHSSMVRLEIKELPADIKAIELIYIPVWLDQK